MVALIILGPTAKLCFPLSLSPMKKIMKVAGIELRTYRSWTDFAYHWTTTTIQKLLFMNRKCCLMTHQVTEDGLLVVWDYEGVVVASLLEAGLGLVARLVVKLTWKQRSQGYVLLPSAQAIKLLKEQTKGSFGTLVKHCCHLTLVRSSCDHGSV